MFSVNFLFEHGPIANAALLAHAMALIAWHWRKAEAERAWDALDTDTASHHEALALLLETSLDNAGFSYVTYERLARLVNMCIDGAMAEQGETWTQNTAQRVLLEAVMAYQKEASLKALGLHASVIAGHIANVRALYERARAYDQSPPTFELAALYEKAASAGNDLCQALDELGITAYTAQVKAFKERWDAYDPEKDPLVSRAAYWAIELCKAIEVDIPQAAQQVHQDDDLNRLLAHARQALYTALEMQARADEAWAKASLYKEDDEGPWSSARELSTRAQEVAQQAALAARHYRDACAAAGVSPLPIDTGMLRL